MEGPRWLKKRAPRARLEFLPCCMFSRSILPRHDVRNLQFGVNRGGPVCGERIHVPINLRPVDTPQIVFVLVLEPALRRRTEESLEAGGGVGADAALAAENLTDPAGRDPEGVGQVARAEP